MLKKHTNIIIHLIKKEITHYERAINNIETGMCASSNEKYLNSMEKLANGHFKKIKQLEEIAKTLKGGE